jgi:signal transduction histidine kinase
VTRRVLSFRAKLLAGHVGLVLAVLLLVLFELNRSLALDLRAQLTSRLRDQALGAAPWVRQNRHPEKLAARMAEVVGARVTIADNLGNLLADSDPDAGAEELGTRPEILAALRGEVGEATREEGEAGEVAYVAVRATDDLLVRLSAPLSDVEAPVDAMRNRLLFALALAIGAAALLGIIASRVAARPLRAMTNAADRLAKGDYDISLPAPSPDEFGVLTEALSSLAKQLQEDMTRIQKLEKIRRDFVANLSHELRTPVTAVQGYAETLLEGHVDEDKRREFLEVIHHHANRLNALVSALLRLSAIEARAPEDTTREPVDLGAIARHVVATARPKSIEHEVTLETSFPEPARVWGDPLGVEQIVDNLVDNAIKYGKRGGTVRVNAVTEGDWMELRVSDDGPGIQAEHLPRLFERFYRVDPGRSRAEGGMGLGLAIVRHLTEAMGGRIDVESKVGAGTTFTVTLPTFDAS